MTRAALSALLSHWRRRPLQFLTLILGLALATALWSGVQAINAEARASYANAAEALGGDADRIVSASGGTISLADYGALRRAGWQVSPVLEGRISTETGSVRLIGIDPITAPPSIRAAETALDAGLSTFITGPGQILAAQATAARLEGTVGLPEVSISDQIAPGLAFADIGVAQRILESPGEISYLLVVSDQDITANTSFNLPPQLSLQPASGNQDLARLTDSFHLNLTAFGLLSFAVGLFIVNGTVGLAFEQRRPVIRTLRVLGVPTSRLIALLLAELLIFALVAGALGLVLGYLIAAALLPDVAATLRGLYGAPVEGALTIRPAWWLAGLAIAILGTAVASAAGLWKIARMPILAPARPRAWAMASERSKWAQAGAALALWGIALIAGLFGSGLVSGFLMLGALLVGCALFLPIVLSFALSLAGRRARAPLTQWFWADTQQQLPGLSLALMALLLALATNIGVGTMVSSFRLTFTGWLDQRLASELYVRAETPAQAAQLTAYLEPRVAAILPIWNTDITVNGAPAELFGVADHPTYRDNWPLLSALDEVWDEVARGRGVLINEQMARRDNLSPGDLLALPKGALIIAGVYSDYGNPLAQVLISPALLTARYPDVEQLNFGIRTADLPVDALMQDLTRAVGIPPDNMTDQASLKRFSLDVFDRTFSVSAALNVLTLAVAGFAILTSLLTLAAMRLPQLAPVWALGLTRKGLAQAELLRALVLAALTAICAIPVGLILAWVLLAVINVEAFGWRLPMHLFPGDWARLGALSLLAAAVASLWPALRLARIAPSELIKVFAHER